MSQNVQSTLLDLIDTKDLKKMEILFNDSTKDKEYEFMFFNFGDSDNITYEKYIAIMNYIKKRSKGLTIDHLNTLDIIYSDDDQKNAPTVYRITISGNDEINKYMEMLHTRKNHVIFSKMVDLYFDEKRGGNIDILKKVKDAENMIDIVDYNIRVRLAQELKPTKSELESLKKLTPEKMNSVIYRYKHRVSLYVYKKNNEFVR